MNQIINSRTINGHKTVYNKTKVDLTKEREENDNIILEVKINKQGIQERKIQMKLL